MAYRLYLKDPGMFDKVVPVSSLAEIEAALESHTDYSFALLQEVSEGFKTHGVWTREPGEREWTDRRPSREVYMTVFVGIK